MTAVKRQYFGTDGIRGTVGQEPMTPDFVLRLAHTVGSLLKQHDPHPLVLIGKDTRISGYMLESALEAGFNSAGVDVLLLGPIPTPGVAYLTRAQRASMGVVISASHNPHPDNGIKFFDAAGNKLSESWESQVEAMLLTAPVWAKSMDLGKTKRLDDAAGRYIEFCKSMFPSHLTLKGLKLVVDAAHGAAYHIAPKVFQELGAEVVTLGCQPDGLNINLNVGATHTDAVVEHVKAHQADLGIALDGDADRLMMVGSTGRLFNGDELLYVLADDRLTCGELVPGVVGTLMTNMAIELSLQKLGVALVRSQVGDRYVLEALEQRGWILGGEGSGHLLSLDKQTTGDGIVSALLVLQACMRQGKTLEQLLEPVSLLPQVLLNVKVQAPKEWSQNLQLMSTLKACEDELGKNGRVLIRPSGTEPVLRIMVEAQEISQAQAIAEKLAAVASK
ncbi:MAG: phosphoglucosamine mutase [Betaproteobacteria bacterium]|nr:phosphoglucosamine mutase [Betaproteobacteria bacterium]